MSGKQFSADVIVANSDLTYTIDQLLKDDQHGDSLMRKQFSCSTITFFWGLKRRYPELLTHNIFLTKDNFEGYDQVINKHAVPSEPHFYVHAPARSDIHMAPPGQDTITVIVPIGHLTPDSPKDWGPVKEQVKQFVLQRFQEIGLSDFKQNIKFELTSTPVTWRDEYNLHNGSTLGFHHNILQMGYFRPTRQHSTYKNLYYVGSNTHPGSGVPTVLLSAYFTSQRILDQHN